MGKLEFDPPIEDLLKSDEPYTAIVGRNNTGKTSLLKSLRFALAPRREPGEHTLYLGVDRFRHAETLEERRDQHGGLDWFKNAASFNGQNRDDSPGTQLPQLLGAMEDSERRATFALVSELLGRTWTTARRNPKNELTSLLVWVEGEIASGESTGARLCACLVAALCSTRAQTLIIDEPELGLAPALQTKMARLLQDPQERATRFPHLQRVIVSTHSPLFVDRSTLSHNVLLERSGERVAWRRLSSVRDLWRIRHDLLGEPFEALGFPSAMVWVEGESDAAFLEHVTKLRFPEARVSYSEAGGSGKMPGAVKQFAKLLGDRLENTPLYGRVLAVIDKRLESAELSRLRVALGEENVTQWRENGIEHRYPKALLAKIFQCSESDAAAIALDGSTIECNARSLSKVELSKRVIGELREDCRHDDQLEALLEKIGALVG